MSWLLSVMRPFGSTVTPSPLVPTPPSRLNPPSGGKPMVPLKPPSTIGGQTMILQTSTLFPPPPSPPSALPPPPSFPPPPLLPLASGKRDTSPLHVQPETAPSTAATIRKGKARRVIGAVSTRGGTGLWAQVVHPRTSDEESSGGLPGRSTLERPSRRRRPEGLPHFRHALLFRCRETQDGVTRHRQGPGDGCEAGLPLRLGEAVQLGGRDQHPSPCGDEVGQCADVLLGGADLRIDDGHHP